MTVNRLIRGLRARNDRHRQEALLRAPDAGVAAIAALGTLAQDEEHDLRRRATRALWAVVRRVGRPGADAERAEACEALLALLQGARVDMLRRDILAMLSEIAGDREVPALAALLDDSALREDARMALERIPADAARDALAQAFAKAPDAFKPALAQSLRARGLDTPGFPCVKRVPAYPDKVEG
jgi:hypothetical protein